MCLKISSSVIHGLQKGQDKKNQATGTFRIQPVVKVPVSIKTALIEQYHSLTALLYAAQYPLNFNSSWYTTFDTRIRSTTAEKLIYAGVTDDLVPPFVTCPNEIRAVAMTFFGFNSRLAAVRGAAANLFLISIHKIGLICI